MPDLTIKSGPFKGKPQQWFTRAEVIALLDEDKYCMSDVFAKRDPIFDTRGRFAAAVHEQAKGGE